MAKRPWSILVGSAVVVIATVVVISRLQPAVEAGGAKSPPPAGTCPESPARGAGPDRGAAWRLADQLDAEGSIVGRHLAVGHDGSVALELDLPTESAVSGPVQGLVVVATDDGWRSQIRLVSASKACAWLVAEVEEIVRSAIFDPVDKTVLAHFLDRSTRDDRGVWSVSALAAADEVPVRIAPPAGGAAADLGEIWTTDLRLEPNARRLAIQQCLELGCVTRLLDLRGKGRITTIGDGAATQGSLIGFGPNAILTWGWCPGLPCKVVAWDMAGGETRELTDGAVAAAVTPNGRWLVMVNDPSTGRSLRVDLTSGREDRLAPFEGGALPLAAGIGALAGLEVADDEIAIAEFDADPRPFRPSAAEAIK